MQVNIIEKWRISCTYKICCITCNDNIMIMYDTIIKIIIIKLKYSYFIYQNERRECV